MFIGIIDPAFFISITPRLGQRNFLARGVPTDMKEICINSPEFNKGKAQHPLIVGRHLVLLGCSYSSLNRPLNGQMTTTFSLSQLWLQCLRRFTSTLMCLSARDVLQDTLDRLQGHADRWPSQLSFSAVHQKIDCCLSASAGGFVCSKIILSLVSVFEINSGLIH